MGHPRTPYPVHHERTLTRSLFLLAFLLLAAKSEPAVAQEPSSRGELEAIYPSLDSLYADLHLYPELSLHEEKTSAKLASRLRSIGFEVTEKVGGYGIVGVLKNGNGPTVLVRTDMDALPIREETGLDCASTQQTKNDAGMIVPIMHACGHDVHMTAWIGAATLLSRNRKSWHGTLVFVGQPAEEVVQGAKRMIRDGLYTRFPKPDVAIGIHVDPLMPAGEIGIAPGPGYAASNSVDITFYGRGGHGASPQLTIDPIVMAARAVVAFQTIVSREVNPLDPAVVTVGTFHAGTKRNIIPDQAQLSLTVRSFKPEVQKHLLASIERIAKGEAAAAGAPREPAVVVDSLEATDVVYNDPALSGRLMKALRKNLGAGNVKEVEPRTGSEDFGVYGQVAGIPGLQMRIGASNPAVLAQAAAAGEFPPGLHTSSFAPDREPTIRTAVAAFTLSVRELLGSPK